MRPRVVVVDYGIGNLLSVSRAFEHCGADVTVTDDHKLIGNADRLVVPGVGAFGDCMAGLRSRNLIEPIKTAALSGRPFLGICVGMQMMLEDSSEFGSQEGLGLIPGHTLAISPARADGGSRKIPHIGWNRLRAVVGGCHWHGSILEGIGDNEYVYFLHSYSANPADSQNCLAISDYDGYQVSAVIADGAMFGCQFHPEKSGPVGLGIIANFIRF
jgi:imidazole glycerol-phosphate synthase subunit HisH